jgi:MEKHLA domain
MTIPAPSAENGWLESHAALLLASYARLLGRPLVDAGRPPAARARALYEAPFVVLSHGGGADPTFDYGNLAAQRLFELSWAELVALPSRLSAEPLHRDERERLLGEVARRGFIEDYRGVRISRTGRRFRIERAVVWNLADAAGAPRGQAATFDRWVFLDGGAAP